MKTLKLRSVNRKYVQQNYVRVRQRGNPFFLLSYIIVLIDVLATLGLLVYGFGNANTFVIDDVTDSLYGEKNTLLIWTIIVAANIIFVFLAAVIRLAVNRWVCGNVCDRQNEQVTVTGEGIEYCYQNQIGSNGDDMVVVNIPFAQIRQVVYDPVTKEVCFTGAYHSRYYEDYAARETQAGDEMLDGKITMLDHYEPSLVNAIMCAGYNAPFITKSLAKGRKAEV